MDLVVDPQIQMDFPKVLEVLGMQMSPNGKMFYTHVIKNRRQERSG